MRGPRYGTPQAAGLSTAPKASETRQLIVSVASGKGGTGKTLVATSLALSLSGAGAGQKREVQFLDCDVEEPNGHLFLKPAFTSRESARIPIPVVDDGKCTYCGRCSEVCAYNAIAVVREKVLVFPELCHGCGACSYFCPEDAISEEGKEAGVVEAGSAGPILFVHGKLNIGDYLGNGNNHSFSNSVISSPTIGSVSLIGVERANGGQEHGIAGTTLSSVKVKQPDGISYSWSGSTNTWKTIPAGGWQNFDINIL